MKKLLIVTDVISDRPVDFTHYEPLIQDLTVFLGNRFEAEKIDRFADVESRLAMADISAVIFLSGSMINKAMILRHEFPAIDFLVFYSRRRKDDRNPYDNVFLIEKDANGQKGKHFLEMLAIITPG
ncbi:MAG: hypothetical protein PHE24_06760 [Patescibacteria group bacterium]|nr:hypothetical protein [Patescibacteria group bacterium]